MTKTKPYYVCDGCGAHAPMTESASFQLLPRGWFKIREPAKFDNVDGFDWCEECSARAFGAVGKQLPSADAAALARAQGMEIGDPGALLPSKDGVTISAPKRGMQGGVWADRKEPESKEPEPRFTLDDTIESMRNGLEILIEQAEGQQ